MLGYLILNNEGVVIFYYLLKIRVHYYELNYNY